MSTTVNYIPALRYKWLIPFYDFFINLTMPEKKMKRVLIEAADMSSNLKVLAFGCGTATDAKRKALAETFIVLGNNGELFIADFGRSKSWLQRTLFSIIRWLDGYKSTDAKGLLPELMEEAGFEKIFKQKKLEQCLLRFR